jgi:transmembrane 9 superfamily protein 2/4
MQMDEQCKFLCQADDIPVKGAQFINERIKEGYAHNWAVDGLPAANEDVDLHTNEKYYKIGFTMGSVYNDVSYLNNHYDIKIHYHVTSRGLSRVVGVQVEPFSRDTKSDKKCVEGLNRFHLEEDGKSSVIYTYSVTWIVSYPLS